MAFTLSVTRSCSGVTAFTNTEAPTGNRLESFNQLVPAAANTLYVFLLKRSQLQAVCMTTTADVDIYTNAASGGSPTDHIVLKAGKVYTWSLAQDTLTAGPGLTACPISADITVGIYITAAVAATVQISALCAA